MKLNDKWSQLSKKSKLAVGLVGLVCVVAVVGGGSVYANSQSQKRMAIETQQTLDSTTTKLSDLSKKVQSLFDSKDQNYLAENVTEKQVNELKKEVGTIISSVSKDTLSGNKTLDQVNFSDFEKAKKNINSQLEKAEKAVQTQTAINSLYKQDKENVAMNGTKVKKDLPIADDLKKETVEEAKKDFFEKDTKIPYNQTINELLTIAENQVNQIEKAKNEVVKVFKDGKVVSTDKKIYESAKIETDKIKNEKAKKELLDQLAKVKSDLDKKEKEESEKAKKDEASAQTVNNKEVSDNSAQANAVTDQGNQSAQANVPSTPTYDGGTGNYTPTEDYQAPSEGNNAGTPAPTPQTPQQPSTGGGNGQGIMTQDEMDKAAEEASKQDPTKDPNSPWYQP